MDVGGICVTPLWNESVSWDTNDPYITGCFKHLVLVVGSCAVLWIVAPLEFVKIFGYRGVRRPWTALSISKMVCKVLLLIICVIELSKEIYAYVNHIKYGLDALIAATAYFITIVLTVVLTMMCKRRGLRPSLALPSFWMISTITTIITLYDDIRNVDWNDWISSISLVDDSVVFVISLIQLVLSSMSDTVPAHAPRQLIEECPLDGRSLLSRLTYGWMLSFLAKSANNSLHHNHLIPQCYELRSATVSRRFNSIRRKKIGEKEYSSSGYAQLASENEDFSSWVDTSGVSISDSTISLFKILMSISRKSLIISTIIEILYCGLYFLPLYVLRLILYSTEEEEWHKYFYAIALFLSMLLSTIADAQRKYYALFSAMKIKTAVVNALFEKVLVSQRLQDIRTKIDEDAESIFQMACFSTDVWGAPLRLLIGIYLLWYFLGSASFIGIATAALLIPISSLLENLTDHFKNKSSTTRKERLDVVKEVLYKIKVIKMYAWEKFFLQKLMSIRKSEASALRKALFFKIGFKFITLSSSLLVAMSTFTVFVVMGNDVDVKIVFIGLYIIYLLKSTFSSLLYLLSHFLQGLVAISHIQKFLEEKNTQSLEPNAKQSGHEISLENASFSWGGNDTCLKKLNVQSSESSLIAVVGDAQSGKSSLLQALLGEMQLLDGYADVKGDIAFVADTPWIQNSTLEKNILFLRPKVDAAYRKILEACDLLEDIEILPQGDETEIGEQGYHLNEDQKLKVDLARAVYQDVDIYLLDEPFRCAKHPDHLYRRVIGHSGMLKNKIRIFTTSDPQFLPLVDQVLYLENGSIVEQGKYSELLQKNGRFSKYVDTYAMANIKSSPKQSRKLLTDAKDELHATESIKGYCDPWYFTSVQSLKPNAESQIFSNNTYQPKGLLRYLQTCVKLNGYVLTMASVLAACAACGCETASWIWWVKWSSKYHSGHNVYSNLYVYIGFIMAQVLFTAVCGIFICIGSTVEVARLYKWLLNRVLRAPRSAFGPSFIDKLFQSLNKDLQDADEKLPMVFYVWLMTAFKAPVLLLVIYFNSPILIIFSLPLAIAYVVILKMYLSTWRQLHHLTSATRFPLSHLLNEVLHGISNIRAYKAHVHYITRFQTKMDAHNNCYFLFLLVSRWLSCSIEIIGAFFVLFTSITYFTEKHHDSPFVGLVIIFAILIAENLVTLTYMSSLLELDLTAIERLGTFSVIKQESEWENPSCELPPMWPGSGHISIENLSTVYAETLYPVLHDINLNILPKQKVAIYGEEGDGIYAILDSLFRIREIDLKQIFIDNIDIRDIGLQDFRSRLAFVPQDPLVFNGSLRENLDPMNQYTDEEVWAAVKLSKLDSCFSDLYEAIQSNISLESKHKISYARCFLKKSKVVILDDPEFLNEDRRQLFPDSTLLTFTKSTNQDGYDRFITLTSGGEVIETFSKSGAVNH